MEEFARKLAQIPEGAAEEDNPNMEETQETDNHEDPTTDVGEDNSNMDKKQEMDNQEDSSMDVMEEAVPIQPGYKKQKTDNQEDSTMDVMEEAVPIQPGDEKQETDNQEDVMEEAVPIQPGNKKQKTDNQEDSTTDVMEEAVPIQPGHESEDNHDVVSMELDEDALQNEPIIREEVQEAEHGQPEIVSHIDQKDDQEAVPMEVMEEQEDQEEQEQNAEVGLVEEGAESSPAPSDYSMLSDRKNMNVIPSGEITDLLSYFAKNTYRPHEGDTIPNQAMQNCLQLFKLDYNILLINNSSGELSSHYPSQLAIIEFENNRNNSPSQANLAQRTTNTIYEHIFDDHKLRDLIQRARLARCRARFPVPVILYKGKYICRSGTLSGGPEIYGRSGYDYLFNTTDPCDNDEDTTDKSEVTQSDWQLFGRVRSADIKLLKALNITTIVDFMVEKKKVKFGVNVTSSEKVDKENRYSEFNLISLPYPGCEFFKDYRDNNYEASGLVFDWSQAFVDASICVPEDNVSNQLPIDWSSYKTWDLETITKNYLKLLLKRLAMSEGTSGLLIHCISGWDRTPLFVSLLRLSLWADGLIHQSLDAKQILYLTVAYDWMLFGHHLPDRLSKGEEIFYFCFNLLKGLTEDEFSIQSPPKYKGPKTDRMTDKPARTDSDTLLDALMSEADRGSNASLNSTCSSVSTKSQEIPPMFPHSQNEDANLPVNQNNGNPVNVNEPGTSVAKSPQSRRTSPVTVPVTKLRQRQESSSSLSMGSWQMITGTGSVRDSEPADNKGLNANNENTECSQSSTHDEEDLGYSAEDFNLGNRKKRLMKVREIFLNNYHATVGSGGGKNGDSALGSLLGNIAEKVGLSART